MLPIDNRQRLLRVFFDDPLEGSFQLRELSRKIRLSPPSVKIYLDSLAKDGLVLKNKHRVHGYPIYQANRDNPKFRFLKKLDSLERLNESGLVDHLYDSCTPDAIILFGSASRGEDVNGSDIDLCLVCKARKLELSAHEKKLGRKINILFAPDFRKLSAELKNNLINGTVLRGYLSVF